MDTGEEGEAKQQEVEGRMGKLAGALQFTLDKSLQALTYKAFCAGFPKKYVDAYPDLFPMAYEAYLTNLRGNIEVRYFSSIHSAIRRLIVHIFVIWVVG